jgi:hypothetical protein
MTAKERVLQRERQRGYEAAKVVQNNADTMTGTELYAVDDRIPSFKAAVARMNMLDRPVGFVCKSSAGRVVRLLQVYDSDIYTQEPEELPAQWGFKWSTDPEKALPFVAISTSPYMLGDCCSVDGVVYRSAMDNNVWSPVDYPSGWETVE